MADPQCVMVAGDWHGNFLWATSVIRQAPRLLPGEERRIILHLGDFGIWPGPGGKRYVQEVEKACRAAGAEIWFVDGNHEDFTQVRSFDPHMSRYRYVTHLPRGWRWQWHGREWLALGGAASVDKAVRHEGISWWPEEEITREEAAAFSATGHADVMVTHDCPSGVRHSFAPPPSFWADRDLARSDAHRKRLQGVVNAVQPRWLMHGHLHRAYQRECDFGYGPVEVTGLDCDSGDGPNYALLDVQAMAWDFQELPRE